MNADFILWFYQNAPKGGATIAALGVLAMLEKAAAPLTATQLSTGLKITHASVHNLLRALVATGLVTRSTGHQDPKHPQLSIFTLARPLETPAR